MRQTLRPRLRLLTALAAAAWMALSGPATAQTAPALAEALAPTPVHVGDNYATVIAKRGKPAGEILRGDLQFLTYPDGTLKLRDGIVVDMRASAGPTAGEPAPGAPKAPRGAHGTAHPMTLAKDPVQSGIEAFRLQVRGLFEADKFQELDTLARELIGARALFEDGSWKIYHLHAALKLRTDAPEATWAAEEDRYARWENALPDSVTARAAHLGYLCAYAWKARGSGWSRDVKEDAWPLFENRLAQAYILYQGAAQMAEKSPMLWGGGLGGSPSARSWPGSGDAQRPWPPPSGREPGLLALRRPGGPSSCFPGGSAPRGTGRSSPRDEMAPLPGRLGSEEYARTVWHMYAYSRPERASGASPTRTGRSCGRGSGGSKGNIPSRSFS